MVALYVVVLMFMIQMMVCNNTYGIGNGAVYCNELRNFLYNQLCTEYSKFFIGNSCRLNKSKY